VRTGTSIGDLSEATQKRLTLVACILGSAIVFIDSTVVTIALPAMQRDLGGGLALQQWVYSAYLLTLGSLILVGGSLGDLYGGKRVFVIGVAAFAATSLFAAAAWSADVLILARALQGVAGALLTPAALATITVVFSGEERGNAIGTWTAWTGISFVIGPLLGGWLVDAVSWRAIFLINLPLAAVTIALILVALREQEHEGKRVSVDYVGGLLCALGLAGPVYALIEAPDKGFADPLILFMLVGGIALFGLFLLWETRTKTPMLPLGLFRLRNFAFANLETLSVYAGLSTLTFFLTLFLQQLAGYTPIESGLATLPITVVMFFLSGRFGRLSMRAGPRLFMGIGPLVCAVGCAWIRFLTPGFNYWTDLFPPILLFAFGLSMIVAPLTSTVLADAGPSDAGIASGVNNAIARIAGLLGVAVVGAAAASDGSSLTQDGFEIAMAITAILIALGGVTGLLGIRNRPDLVAAPQPELS
jgi:EmrB/QacA subfamily drug resistance transporter